MKHADIVLWLRTRVGEKVGMAPEALALQVPFEELGLDSLEAANFTGEIERRLSLRIDPSVLWEHGTLWDLSVYLAKRMNLEIEMPESEADLDAVLAHMEAQ